MKKTGFLARVTAHVTYAGLSRLGSLWIMISLATALISISGIIMVTLLINERFDDQMTSATQLNTRQTVGSVADSVDSYLYGLLTNFDSVSSILKRGNTSLSEDLSNYYWYRDINTVAIFDLDGNIIASSSNSEISGRLDSTQQDWFKAALDEGSGYSIGTPTVQRLYDKQYPWVISMSKVITGEGGTQSVALIDLNFDTLRQFCSIELGRFGYLYILGPDAQIIYHPFQQIIYAGVVMEDLQMAADLADGDFIINVDGEHAAVSVRTLDAVDWKIVGVNPLFRFFLYDSEVTNYISIIVFIATLIIVATAVAVSLLITRPIRKLAVMMGRVEAGDFDDVSHIDGAYEVKVLSGSFVNMVRQIKQLMEKLVEEQEQTLKDQEQLKEIEMKFLHAQLNPHFLYNTLDSVVWLAESSGQKRIVKMTEALANYFRLTLSGGVDLIPLENELMHTEKYLTIQKMRFAEQFGFSIVNDVKTPNSIALKNIVQPIVENSVVHGVANMPEKCHISVRAYSDSENLVIEVKDDGCGIKPSVLSGILAPKPASKSGVGIYNVNKRIQLMFGDGYGLRYESEQDEGTTVYITMPLQTKNEVNAERKGSVDEEAETQD